MFPLVSDDFSEGEPISCPICQMDTVADAAFCNHCGERLPARCRACDTLNPPGSAFCYSCGSPIAAGASGAPAYAPPPVSAAPLASYARYDSRQALRGEDDCEYAVGEPVGFWIRLAAFSIDAVAAFAVAFTIALVFNVVEYTVFELLFLASITLYHMIGWSLWQTTVGKRVFNLYVARSDGSKIGFRRSVGRSLAYILSSCFLFMGFLMIAFSEDKCGLHDQICDTVVVRRR